MKILTFLIALIFATTSIAGLPPTTTQGSNDTNPVTTFKFLFPNVTFSHSGTSATFGTVGVASGGTGATSLTSNNVILGNGTSAVQFVAPGSSGNMLVSNGTTWASSGVSGTTLMSSPGITSPKTCYAGFGGASATLAAPTACSTGTCVEVYDTCGTFSPPSYAATGNYENATFAAGTFANSSMVMCRCTSFNTAANNYSDCGLYYGTADNSWSTDSSGGYVVSLGTGTLSGTAANHYVQISCAGQAP